MTIKKCVLAAALVAATLGTGGCISVRPGDDIARSSADHVIATNNGEMLVEGNYYNNLANATAGNTTFTSEVPSRAVEVGGLTRDALDGIAGRRPPTQARTNWNNDAQNRPANQLGSTPPPQGQQGQAVGSTPPAQGQQPQLNQPRSRP